MKALLICLGAAWLSGTAYAQNAGPLRPGLWEMRSLKNVADGRDMLPERKAERARVIQQVRDLLEHLPAERRQQTEAMIGPPGGDPLVLRLCVSAEMAQDGWLSRPLPQGRADCAEPQFQRRGNRVTYTTTCSKDAATVTGEVVETAGQVRYTLSTASTGPDGTPHTVLTETLLTFINADCAGLKPKPQSFQPGTPQDARQTMPRQ